MNRLWGAGVALLSAGIIAAGAFWWLNEPGAQEVPPPPDDKGTLFRDVTAVSGVHFTYRNGEEANHYAILESLGGGVALIDYDGDGLLDIFLPGGGGFAGADGKQIEGRPSKLYKNLGGFKFKDVTHEVGLDEPLFYTHGAAVADYDRDGWPDLLVTGYGRVALYRNVSDGKGGRRFREVTRAAGLLGGHVWATSAAWADLDGDGFPDLYVCQYVDWSFDNHPRCEGYTASIPRDICPPRQFDALPHLLYHNNGDGTFREVGKQAGLRGPRADKDYERLTHLGADARKRLRAGDREKDFGKGLGVLVVDVDGDGRPDVFVANDTTDKFLYLNRSRKGTVLLDEEGFPLGAAVDDRGVPNGSMGVHAADYDGSGRPALLVTNYENELHALYRNLLLDKKLSFKYSARSAGLDSLGRQHVGFGTGFLDFDNDGWEDVFIAQGHVIRHPTRARVRQRPVLMHNQGRRVGQDRVVLVDVTEQGGPYFQATHRGRGVAIGDLDNDGRPDLVISHVNEPVALLRNEAAGGRHWLGVELVGKGHRDVVGARLTLQVGGRELTRFAGGGGSYLSSGDRRHLFGLGNETKVGRLTVAWPSGRKQHWNGLAVNRYWRLVEDEHDAQPFPRAPR